MPAVARVHIPLHFFEPVKKFSFLRFNVLNNEQFDLIWLCAYCGGFVGCLFGFFSLLFLVSVFVSLCNPALGR